MKMKMGNHKCLEGFTPPVDRPRTLAALADAMVGDPRSRARAFLRLRRLWVKEAGQAVRRGLNPRDCHLNKAEEEPQPMDWEETPEPMDWE